MRWGIRAGRFSISSPRTEIRAAIRFGDIKIRGNAYDFSFSGLKTAVFYFLRDHPELREETQARTEALTRGERKAAQLLPLCSTATLDLIASFQRAVVTDLVKRTLNAAQEFKMRSILVSGGVAANSELRTTFEKAGSASWIEGLFPKQGALYGQCGDDCCCRVPEVCRGAICGCDAKCGVGPTVALAEWRCGLFHGNLENVDPAFVGGRVNLAAIFAPTQIDNSFGRAFVDDLTIADVDDR